MRKFTQPFEYNGRIYRVVWEGLGICRLQDNKGFTYLVTYERIREMQLGISGYQSVISGALKDTFKQY